MRRRAAALLALLAGLLGAAFLLAGPAAAHATLVTSTPADGARLAAAPKTVTLVFDEPVGLTGVGYLHVTDQHGGRVDAGAAFHPDGAASKVADTLRSGLGDGTYTASYRVISADSHPVAGAIRFVVGNGPLVGGAANPSTSATNGVTSAVFDVARWVSYGGIALLGGAWLVLTVWPAGRDDRRARTLIWTGWTGAVVGALAEVLLQGPYSAGAGLGKLGSWPLLDATLHSDYGQWHSARLALLGVLAIVFARSLQADARPARWEAVAGVLGIGVAWTFSASGHAATTAPSGLSIPLDMLHLLAMSGWLGGLAMLVVALLPRREPDELRAALPTFSTTAFVCVVVLAGTGTYAAWRGIGSLHAILHTTYGLLVVGKVVLFLGLIALGNLSRILVQRRFTTPRIAFAMTDAVATEDADADEGTDEVHAVDTERLRRSVAVETIVALIVLALTAVLVAEPRGAEALATQDRQPVTGVAPLGAGRSVTVTADPGTHGPVTLTLTESGGGPAPRHITATATQQQAQIGPLPVHLHGNGARSYAGSVNLPVAGAWRIDLVVTTSPLDAAATDVTLTLH